METVKSPKFWLALCAMIIVAVLCALKHVSGDAAIGVIIGVMGGFGVASIPGGKVKNGITGLILCACVASSLFLGGCTTTPLTREQALNYAKAYTGIACQVTILSCNFIANEFDRNRCITISKAACLATDKVFDVVNPPREKY